MIPETGTRDEVKRWILDDLWVWELPCGHRVPSDWNYSDEFKKYQYGKVGCPVCGQGFRDPFRIVGVRNITRD